MRKRIGALGLSAVLLLAMICPALAAGTTFVVKGPDQAPRKGETFTVTVELENNPGFNAIQFTLTYDKEEMTCTDAKVGVVMGEEMLSVTNPDADDGAIIVGASVDAMPGDGVVGTFSFTAGSDLTNTEFGLIIEDFCDENGTDLPYEVEIDGVKQTETIPATVSTPTLPEPQFESAPDPQPASESEPTSTPQSVPESPATPQPVQEYTFTDTKGHWAESCVARAAELGLFKGYPDGSFGPNVNVTRAQYVTVLYRMAGSPAVTAEAPFTDIASQSQEFRTAIAWGYEKGYLNGKGEGLFDPNGPVTRQEAMKILFGYDGGVSGMEVMFTGIYDDAFTDSDQLASWGKPAMYWGVYKSLITGTSDTTLSPKGTATRAQLAKILTSYHDLQKQ